MNDARITPTTWPPAAFPWPFDGPHFRQTLGIQSLKDDDWIALDDETPAQRAERDRLIRTHGRAVLDGDVDGLAARELHRRVEDHLRAYAPFLLRPEPAGTGQSALERLGRLVGEDFCLLERRPEGWCMSAAILCFPNRWRLSDKLGRPLAGIHEPVPGYAERLAGPVDRFFERLAPGRGVWRVNWSLSDDPALYQPLETAHRPADPTLDGVNAGERLFLRVERQTLVKLPESGAVAFGIRTVQRPLDRLTKDQCAELAAVLRDVPDDVGRYKGLHRTGRAALEFLDGAAAH